AACFSFLSRATRSFSFARAFCHACHRSFQDSRNARRGRRNAIDFAHEKVVTTKSEGKKNDKARIRDPARLKRARNQSAKRSPARPPAFRVQPQPRKFGNSKHH